MVRHATIPIETVPVAPGPQTWRDWLGVAASIMCAVHCAAMPFVVGFLPLLGMSFFADAAFHQWMVAICLGLAVLAFVPGWRLHRRLSPALVAAGGLSLIAAAAFSGSQDCCPSGAAGHPWGVVATAAGEPAPQPADAEPSACQAGDCSVCGAATGPPATEERTRATAPGSAWPWVTPCGGSLLVAAHLFNRRLTCLCCRTRRPAIAAGPPPASDHPARPAR